MNHSISYTSFRDKLKKTLDDVCTNHLPILVTRKNGEEVVVVAKTDYDSLEETAYLLKSPANAQRLIDALSSTDKKKFKNIKELQDALNIN